MEACECHCASCAGTVREYCVADVTATIFRAV